MNGQNADVHAQGLFRRPPRPWRAFWVFVNRMVAEDAPLVASSETNTRITVPISV
jgi:hypothetical protein